MVGIGKTLLEGLKQPAEVEVAEEWWGLPENCMRRRRSMSKEARDWSMSSNIILFTDLLFAGNMLLTCLASFDGDACVTVAVCPISSPTLLKKIARRFFFVFRFFFF